MGVAYNSRIITDGLVLALDAANNKSILSAVEVLVVAGGGGGGMDMGGGGGGGGVIYSSAVSITPGSAITATVGNGGVGAPAGSTNGQPGGHQFTISATQGGNSVFGALTAIGGGFGASSYYGYLPNYGYGGTGGSGGGCSGYTHGGERYVDGTNGSTANNTAGQGFVGGNSGNPSSGGDDHYSGGGGGAGGRGTSGPNHTGPNGTRGDGGSGVLYPSMSPYYFAGGGGGSGYSGNGGYGGIGGGGGGSASNGNVGLAGTGGINIGSNGSSGNNAPGGNAGANTGGGGGGGSHYNANNKGGDGGSGIIIVRYPGSQRATGGTVTSVGGYTIHTFTTSGTFTPTWGDMSTNGNTGTFTTGVTYNSANGGSLSFDGGDASHIQIVNTAGQLDFPGDFTVGLWIYPTQYHRTYQTMIDTYPGGATNGWIFTTMYSSSQVISWYTEGSSWQPSGTAVTLNAWNYVVASRIGTTVKLYKNATEIHSHSDSSNIRGGVCRIGRGLDDANNYGNIFGRISNVQIYKGKGLTAAEVSQNFNALRGRFGI